MTPDPALACLGLKEAGNSEYSNSGAETLTRLIRITFPKVFCFHQCAVLRER